jgi:hypothetical protein
MQFSSSASVRYDNSSLFGLSKLQHSSQYKPDFYKSTIDLQNNTYSNVLLAY